MKSSDETAGTTSRGQFGNKPIPELATVDPGDVLDDVLEWQHQLRNAVDELVAERMRKPFAEAFRTRFENGEIQRPELCKWANSILRQCKLYLKCPETQRPGFLIFSKALVRESDPGRIYISTLGDSGSRVRKTMVREPQEFDLIASTTSNRERGDVSKSTLER